MKVKRALVKNISIPIIDSVMASAPVELKGAWFAVRAAYGFYTDLYPQEGNKFMNDVKSHISQVNEQIISSKQFQQALALTLETLLKTRELQKRKIIMQLFLTGYITPEQRERVYIERFYRVCQEISLEALEHLIFIDKVILPMKYAAIQEKVRTEKSTERENSDEWWIDHYHRLEPDSSYIMKWVYNEFNPNSELVNARTPNILDNKDLTRDQFEKEKEQSRLFAEFASELLSLGIFRAISAYDGMAYSLTDFGKDFIRYAKLS